MQLPIAIVLRSGGRVRVFRLYYAFNSAGRGSPKRSSGRWAELVRCVSETVGVRDGSGRRHLSCRTCGSPLPFHPGLGRFAPLGKHWRDKARTEERNMIGIIPIAVIFA